MTSRELEVIETVSELLAAVLHAHALANEAGPGHCAQRFKALGDAATTTMARDVAMPMLGRGDTMP
jgi:hypothetical protein